jgi:hypothetical protein
MTIIRSVGLWAALAFSANAATLIHSYTFTGNANDGTGSQNGTLFGGATVSGGILALDGVNDYLEFGAGLIPGSGSFSVLISAKLLISAPQPFYMELISQGGGFYLGPAASSGEFRVGDPWPFTGVIYPNDGDWHTFALTSNVDSNTTTLYVDGGFAASRSGTTNPGAIATRLGRQYNGHAEYFNGQLDDFQVYTGALTAGEVEALSGSESSVPEPWTMALTGAGLIAVGLRRRLRAKHHHAG